MLTWQQIYENTHQFGGGVVTIAVPFTGNTLAIECSTKPEYALTKQVIGYIQQFSGDAQKGYALYSGKDIVQLSLPETDSLIFVPTNFLSDNYTLSIASTTIGAISGENSEPIPPLILGLPNRVNTLEADLYELDTTVGSQGTAITALQNSVSASSWEALTGKPNSFPPSSHNHAIGEITNLTGFLATYALKNEVPSSLLGANTAIGALQTSDTEQNIAIGTLQTDASNLSIAVSNLGNSSASLAYTLLSTNQALESNKKYLASVTGLVCSLPSSPAIGDVISLSTGDFDLRINHDNASRRIVNLSTLTTIGTGNGIILKPYADIDLVFMGANLWKTAYRSRIVNNFTPIVETPLRKVDLTFSSAITANAFGTTFQSMQNGVKTGTGNFVTDGFLRDTNSLGLVVTSAAAFCLKELRLWNGQGNVGSGASGYWTNGVTVYLGSDSSGQNLGTVTFTNNTGLEQVRAIVNNSFSSQYFLAFTASQASIGILELELWANNGGESVPI